MVRALQEAAKSAGAMVEIIAPHVAGAKLSDGKMMAADQKIDGGPSVVYDAVALVMDEAAARNFGEDKPSIDFVSDAFAHAKFIAYVPETMALLEGAGVAKRMDDGFIELSKPAAAKDFIARCAKLRFWDREAVKKD